MSVFYIPDERHTLASALRGALERTCPEDLVYCTLQHPLDTHIAVCAPSEAHVRQALLELKEQIARTRAEVHRQRVSTGHAARESP